MNMRRIAAWVGLLAAGLWTEGGAQTPSANLPGIIQNNAAADGLEIRGTVVEPNPSAGGSGTVGVAGAQVTLTEFRLIDNTLTPTVLSVASTDSQGAFRFRPARLGEYMVEVKMEGYLPAGVASRVEITGTTRYATVSREKPIAETGFTMTRHAEFTGRVLDEDGNPIAKLPVRIYGQGTTRTVDTATTNGDGLFRAANLQSGQYLAGTLAKAGGPALVTPFTAKDADIVDTDYEIAYWPGAADIESATTWTASPGGSINLPDLHLRKIPTYRALVSVRAEACAEAEQRTLLVLPVQPETLRMSPIDALATAMQAPLAALNEAKSLCDKDLLVRNLRPGSYWFALWSGKRESVDAWALQQVEVKDQNVNVGLSMSRGVDINGRLVPAEGANLPPGNTVILNVMAPVPGLPTGGNTRALDGSGRFGLNNVPWGSVRIQPLLIGPRADYYVQAIRLNGQVIPDGIVNLAAGATGPLEIVIDDKPATVLASVFDGDHAYALGTVVLVKLPLAPGVPVSDLQQSRRVVFGSVDNVVGATQIRVPGLAPGEYRAFAVSREDRQKVQDPAILERLAARGEKVMLERGGAQNITLKLSDPSR